MYRADDMNAITKTTFGVLYDRTRKGTIRSRSRLRILRGMEKRLEKRSAFGARDSKTVARSTPYDTMTQILKRKLFLAPSATCALTIKSFVA